MQRDTVRSSVGDTIAELTELLKNDNFELFHFSELIKDNALSFDHKLKREKLKTRNAIKILECIIILKV